MGDFQDVPASPEAAREELALLEAWFQDLQARLSHRESQAVRLGTLSGYLVREDQLAATPRPEEVVLDGGDQDGQLD
jgi:hypothetical protein